ncbi:hypothetical protein YC2023_061902 [Brassica napus]
MQGSQRTYSVTYPPPPPPPVEGVQERVPVADRLGPTAGKSPTSAFRVSIMARLGPLLDEITTNDVAANEPLPPPPRRKPGRHPGRRTVNASPLQGASSKKRLASVKPHVCRRKLTDGKDKTDKANKRQRKNKDSTSDGIPRGGYVTVCSETKLELEMGFGNFCDTFIVCIAGVIRLRGFSGLGPFSLSVVYSIGLTTGTSLRRNCFRHLRKVWDCCSSITHVGVWSNVLRYRFESLI